MQDIGEQAAEMVFRFSARQCKELYSKYCRESKAIQRLQDICEEQKAEIFKCNETMSDLGIKSVAVDPPEMLAKWKEQLKKHGVDFSVREGKEEGAIDLLFLARDEQTVYRALAELKEQALEKEQPHMQLLGPDSDLPDVEFTDIGDLSKESIKEFSLPTRYYIDIENATEELAKDFDSYVFHGQNGTTARLGPYQSRDEAQAAFSVIAKSPKYLGLEQERAEELQEAKIDKAILEREKKAQEVQADPKIAKEPRAEKDNFDDKVDRAHSASEAKARKLRPEDPRDIAHTPEFEKAVKR
jgi:hypothetical protein